MSSVRTGVVLVLATLAGVGGLALSAGTVGDRETTAVGTQTSAVPTTDADADTVETADPMAAGDPYWGVEALPFAPAPEGKEIIAFNDGGMPGLAGYIDDQGPSGWDVPDPALDIGTGTYEATGKEITDADGVLLGYSVNGIGLVDLATARDDGVMDALLTEAAARRAAEPEMTEEEVIETFGDPGDGG